jgi:hypothetical protein
MIRYLVKMLQTIVCVNLCDMSSFFITKISTSDQSSQVFETMVNDLIGVQSCLNDE